MKETIFEHVHNECHITLYRRFVPINAKKNDTSFDFFSLGNTFPILSVRNENFIFKEINSHSGYYDKKNEYFDNSNYITGGNISHSFKTSNSNVIKKLYPDPFAEILSNIHYHKIVKDGDKIKLIKKRYTSKREVNRKYFSKSYTVHMLVFNTVTHNITVCIINKHGKVTDKKIRINRFNFIESMCLGFNKKSPGYNEWRDAILNILAIDISNPVTILEYFIKNKHIKVPNNYIGLLKSDYPGQKFLKKNDNKLVLAILDKNGIKSKRTNSILNINPSHGALWYIKSIVSLFGINYVQYFKDIPTNDDTYNYPNIFSCPKNLISHIEKMRLINIINTSNYNYKINAMWHINDHLDMLYKIKNVGEEFKIKANTNEEFNREHALLTQKYNELRKNSYIVIIYDEKLITLEEPILYENVIYTPVILRTEFEYQSESQIMHHCVSSYITRPDSLIISLRKENEQITIEYNTESGNLMQKRSYCNNPIPEYFNKPVDILSEKVKKLAKKGLLKRLETKYITNTKAIAIENTVEFFEDLEIFPF